MIASLRGTVISASQNQAIIEVAGVGYLVHVTPNTSGSLSVGAEASLMTSFILREDSATLFGFLNADDQQLFDLLLSVSGVGPKSALAVLSQMNPTQIRSAVANEDDASFKAVSGIGPKTSKLIVVQLAGKLGFVSAASGAPATASSSSTSEVVDALMGLGWNERLAIQAVKQAAGDLGSSATKEALLRESLGNLGKSKSVIAE